MEKLSIELSKTGFPVMWESGGGMSNSGDATIIAGSKGERLAPLFVKIHGSLSNANHALFVIRIGYYVIKTDQEAVLIYRILDDMPLKEGENYYTLPAERVSEFSRGEWDKIPPDELKEAIEAAESKATCYHCRTPHYMAVREALKSS